MRLLFVMDPVERIVPEKDTSFGFIEAALALGHECLHALIHQLERRSGGTSSVSAPVRSMRIEGGRLVAQGDARRVDVSELDAVFIRKDPPFDAAYAYATQVLEGVRSQTLVVNDPRGLRDANEKLYALEFPRWTPRTLVTADRNALHAFVAEVGGRAVIKPLSGAGGFGVLSVSEGDSNARAIVDLLTNEGQQLAVMQEYLPAVSRGDKRVLLLDGQPLGAILRVPARGELRANIHVGGSVEPTELDAHERELVADVGQRLRADGLYFVGLDLIGGKLTEVNVTSPTGIRELSTFLGRRVSDDVIRWVEKKRAGTA
ncbi:MAG: glutathione synthase [Deltaproteobacteria bacterium]|nr:glutathione synthase [Deltaproteobacteria bacterium]